MERNAVVEVPAAQTRAELLLPDHHRRLDALLDELRATARADDPRALCACWSRFAGELAAHLAAEEEHLIPAFAIAQPDEARALLREHAEIRKLVDELGVGVDLHLLRVPTFDRLVERLRAHARREDALFYPWMVKHVGGPALHPSLAALQKLLDEVRVKMQLAGAEARSTFAGIEQEAALLRGRADQAAHAAADLLLDRLRTLAGAIAESGESR